MTLMHIIGAEEAVPTKPPVCRVTRRSNTIRQRPDFSFIHKLTTEQ